MNSGIDSLDHALPFIAERRLVLFLGAGVSAIAGCYDWRKMIGMLCGHELVRQSSVSPNFATNPDVDNYEKIQYCKDIFQKQNKMNEYYGILRESTIPDPELFHYKYLPFIKTIKKIEPFPVILTANCDRCLEQTRLFELARFFNNPRDFQISNLTSGSVFHVHGSDEDLENAAFSSSELSKFCEDARFKDFIRHVFLNTCVVFLGYGMGDKHLRDILFDVRRKEAHQPCFWLISENESNTDKIPVFEEMHDLKIVIYGRIEQFQDVLTKWIDKHFGTALSYGD